MKPLLLLIPLFVLANTGEQIYIKKGCYGCHGASGDSGGAYPNIANKPYKYLKSKLNALRNGTTKTATAAIMTPFAQDLSNDEMELILEFLTTKKTIKKSKPMPVESFDSGS